MNIAQIIIDQTIIVPDFPKPGKKFLDFRQLRSDPKTFGAIIETLKKDIAPWNPDILIGHRERQDLVVALANSMGIGFISAYPKKTKLPGRQYSYRNLILSADVLTSAQNKTESTKPLRVAFVDEVVISGSDAIDVVQMVQQAGGKVVHAAFMLELSQNGRQALNRRSIPVTSLVTHLDDRGFTPGFSDSNALSIDQSTIIDDSSITSNAPPAMISRSTLMTPHL